MRWLEGKAALITGAASGIGKAAAACFAREGARLLLADQNEVTLRETAGALGPGVSFATADVSDEGDTAAYVAAEMQHLGGIDVAVLNAGIEGQIASIARTPVAVFDRVMAVNVRGVWLGLAAVFPIMREAGGGSIVITSSTGGLRGSAGMAAYAASKHAVIGLVRSAALEGARDGIRVNAVSPAPIATRMMDAIDQGRSAGDPDSVRAATMARIPLGRYGRAEEVAAMMLFLASDDASFCTGSVHSVDGGVMAGQPTAGGRPS